jgi:hypothetical protein
MQGIVQPQLNVQITDTQTHLLTKIDHIYTTQSSYQQKQRLRYLVKYRQKLVRAEANFKQDLAKAVSTLTQEGLGIKVILNPETSPSPYFIAQFKFLGKQWQIQRHKTWFGCQWSFGVVDEESMIYCSSRNLEAQLCYALGKYRHAAVPRIGLSLLPAASTAILSRM